MLLVKSVISQVSLTHFVNSSPVCRSFTEKRTENVHHKSHYQETKFTVVLFAKELCQVLVLWVLVFKDLSIIH